MSTGTLSPAQRSALATARSSPKLGSVTSTPSISSRWALNRSAHFWASVSDSMAPYLVASTGRVMALMPSDSSTRRISLRPNSHNSAGKKPRFPMMMPKVLTSSYFYGLFGLSRCGYEKSGSAIGVQCSKLRVHLAPRAWFSWVASTLLSSSTSKTRRSRPKATRPAARR